MISKCRTATLILFKQLLESSWARCSACSVPCAQQTTIYNNMYTTGPHTTMHMVPAHMTSVTGVQAWTATFWLPFAEHPCADFPPSQLHSNSTHDNSAANAHTRTQHYTYDNWLAASKHNIPAAAAMPACRPTTKQNIPRCAAATAAAAAVLVVTAAAAPPVTTAAAVAAAPAATAAAPALLCTLVLHGSLCSSAVLGGWH
jgi:hypothetical protein